MIPSALIAETEVEDVARVVGDYETRRIVFHFRSGGHMMVVWAVEDEESVKEAIGAWVKRWVAYCNSPKD